MPLLLYLLISFFSSFSFISPPSTFAQTESSTVTASVPEFTINPVRLIAPSDESVTKNPYEPFVFERSVSDTYINHYDLYLDDVKVAGDISHSALSQDAYFFTASRNGENITVNLKTANTDGYHSWHIVTVTNSGNSVDSDHWQFWLDSQSPLIILEQVDINHMYWSTNDPYAIPPRNQRDLIVTDIDPYLAGKVEAYSNLKFTLLCPSNAPADCHNQTLTVYQPTGVWQHRFRTLIPNLTYLVYLFATDAAGNTNSLPEFSITYIPPVPLIERLFPTPTSTITPTPTPTPTPEILLSPSPTTFVKQGDITPGEFFLTPPEPPPAPPPLVTPSPPTSTTNLLLVIAFTGLITYLFFTCFGAAINFLLLPKFIFTVFLPPFIIPRDDLSLYQSHNKDVKYLPFTQIFAYSLSAISKELTPLKTLTPSQLISKLTPIFKKPTRSFITDFSGSFNFQLPSGHYLLLASHPGFTFPPFSPEQYQILNLKSTILYVGQILSLDPHKPQVFQLSSIGLKSSNFAFIFPLNQKPANHLSHLERLQNTALVTRHLFLSTAFITSLTALVLYSTIPAIIILSLALDLSLNEYLYPFVKTRQIKQRLKPIISN